MYISITNSILRLSLFVPYEHKFSRMDSTEIIQANFRTNFDDNQNRVNPMTMWTDPLSLEHTKSLLTRDGIP
ncbi:hypothetical protein DERF_002028 [Dermatophagoides farinae]|uniref:Uncharacterized protein n=1 Tax=Dermatophagoides farinae TaxID=6954 RepID=A0A922LA19_DERFA|nr:hypothetical protein DERF_002028 [Dermatophagoides farinae]